MKRFALNGNSRAMAPMTAVIINESENKVTVIGRAYFEALAKQRARLDAKRGNHEINDRSVPESYQPYYRKAYAEMWDTVINEVSKDENGQKDSNS